MAIYLGYAYIDFHSVNDNMLLILKPTCSLLVYRTAADFYVYFVHRNPDIVTYAFQVLSSFGCLYR